MKAKKTNAFWDASALVPLCVQESGTPAAESLLRRFPPVAWWGSPVEIRSAICRLHRERMITDAGKKGAILRLELLHRSGKEILPGDDLRELAFRLLDAYPLRTADSFQLAAALIWCNERPARRNFICADQRLTSAARFIGFTVRDLSR
jgi:predicted nucleic acid-binding protein